MADTPKDDNKTPEDLEAEIAATARALGGKSPKEKKATQSSEEPDAAETTDESVDDTADETTPTTTEDEEATTPAGEAEDTDAAEAEEEAEDLGEKLTVTIKKKEAATPPPDEPEAEAEPEKPAVIKHSGKKIAPLSEQEKPEDIAQEADSEQDTEEADDVSSETTTQKPAESQDESEDDTPVEEEQTSDSAEGEEQTEASRKLAAMSGELRAREAQKANTAQGSEEQQTAKVYDTKKYHLPIKAGRHHRRSGFPKWLQIAILLVVLAGTAYYVWANDLLPSFSGPSETAVTQPSEQGAVGLQNQTGVSVLHLLPGIENIGTAVAELTYAPSPNEQSEYINLIMPLVQNKAGSIWFEQPTLAVQLVNEYLSENAVADEELVESKVAADFIDIYGYAPLLADNGSQSLNSALDSLEGAAAVECQAAIDSANVALVGDLRLQQSLTKTGVTSGEVTYQGQTIPVETFTLAGDALGQARTLVEAAIEKCLSQDERADAQQYLRDGNHVRYRVSTDEQYLFIDATDTQSNRLIFRAYLSSTTDIKSSQVPQLVNTIFHPLTRLTSITAACGEIPQQLDTSSSDSLKLISSSDSAYLIVAPFDVPLVCNVDEASLNELPRAEAIELVYDTATYVTLIEMLRGDGGFPSAAQLTTALQEIDASIPIPDGEQIFYSPQPEGCSEDEQQSCTLYILDIAP